MIPERRLETLLLQAVDHQRSSCIYHNLKDETINLFEDHSCDRSQIPRETKRILVKHTDEVWHIQFSHNGRFLASASKDGTAIIWDIQTYQPLHVLLGHSQALSYLAWSPDDSTLLSCSNDHTVRLWSAQVSCPSSLLLSSLFFPFSLLVLSSFLQVSLSSSFRLVSVSMSILDIQNALQLVLGCQMVFISSQVGKTRIC
jgi:WD40 repeat protein